MFNFQKIPPVMKEKEILNKAFSKAKKKRVKERDEVKKIFIEKTCFAVVRDVIVAYFDALQKQFPDMRELSEFYQELIHLTIDFKELKLALGAPRWVKRQISTIYKKYNQKLNPRYNVDLTRIRREYYGRISSIVKQVSDQLEFLESVRKIMRSYPTLFDEFTVCIVGFPNVGKTTLLKELSGAKVQIAPYAFTTKKINVGYMKTDYDYVQLLDTPGTLAREKQNMIELQADLAMEYLADAFIFVYDLTGIYPLKKQELLFNKVKGFKKDVVLYLSKAECLDKEVINEFLKSKKDVVMNLEELNKRIKQLHKLYMSKEICKMRS